MAWAGDFFFLMCVLFTPFTVSFKSVHAWREIKTIIAVRSQIVAGGQGYHSRGRSRLTKSWEDRVIIAVGGQGCRCGRKSGLSLMNVGGQG